MIEVLRYAPHDLTLADIAELRTLAEQMQAIDPQRGLAPDVLISTLNNLERVMLRVAALEAFDEDRKMGAR